MARHSFRPARDGENGRGDRIRTYDLYVPNVALYQAKLRPDLDCRIDDLDVTALFLRHRVPHCGTASGSWHRKDVE